jgi:CheY-like chemotaxis protein
MENLNLKNILLVEDESDIRLLVTMTLSRLGGLEVHAEPSGKGALNYLAEGHHPDLIVLDVMMPEMDGVQTFEAIRALPGFENTPVCFLTAKVHPEEVKRWHQLGIHDVLSKPFSPALLPGQIQACWHKWQQAH